MFGRNFVMRMLNVLVVASLLLGMAPVRTWAAVPSTAETPAEPVAQAASTPQPQSRQAGTMIYLPLVMRVYVPEILPVTLTQYADSWLVLPGDVTTYTLVVQNPGDYPVRGGELMAEVPGIVDLVAGGISHGGVYNAQTRQVHWSLPAMAKGETLTMTFPAQVTASAVVTATSTALLTATMRSGVVYTDSALAHLSVGEAEVYTLMPAGGTLTVPDKKAILLAPAGAVTQPTQVQIASFPVPFEVGELPVRWQVFFDVTALGGEGEVLHDGDGHTRFLRPLTATVGVENTWEQPFLVHMDGFALEEQLPIKAEFDRDASVLTATLQTFSAYGAGGADPYADSGTYHLMTKQPGVGIFNGSATYGYQLDVPEGRRGLTPKLSLNYSSSGINSQLGIVQSGDVGMGWNLGGQVQIVRPIKTHREGRETVWQYTNEFALTINGTSYNLEGYTLDPNGGCRYAATDGPGLRVMRYTAPGYCGYPTGGTPPSNGTGEYWEVTTGDGTVYRLGYNSDSQQLARMSWYGGGNTCSSLEDCGGWSPRFSFGGYAGELIRLVASRWSVDEVRDVYGNVMKYGYDKETQFFHDSEGYWYDRGFHLDWIRYGGNATQNIGDMYLVDFVWEPRTNVNDNGGGTWFDAGPMYNSSFKKEDWSTWDEKRLDRVKVCANPNGTTCNDVTLLAEYDLDYGFEVESSTKHIETTRLESITRYGWDGNGVASVLPATTFGYVSLKQQYPIKSGSYDLTYPRLQTVNNGYGGVATFVYEEVAMNYHHSSFYSELDFVHTYRSNRVKAQITDDGLGQVVTATYTYGVPCFNSWRTADTCSYPRSEADFSLTGHDAVIAEVRGYSGELLSRTWHWFHYKLNENWRMGREKLTSVFDTDSHISQETETQWVMTDTLNSATFTYAAAVTSTDYTVAPALTTWKKYDYNLKQQGGKQLGLLTHVTEYDSQNVWRRLTQTNYVINEDAWLMLPWAISVFGEGWQRGSMKFYLYDTNNDPDNQVLDKGALRLERNLLVDNTPCPATFDTVDAEYKYDVYGNVVTTTTYSGYGRVSCTPGSNGNDWNTVTGPGSGEPRMSRVTYDDVYHLFPVKTCAAVGMAEEQCGEVEYYGVNGNAGICDSSGYFYGAVCREWGPNGPDTAVHYHYDAFGRKTETWLPGENVAGVPSERIQYRDVTDPDWRPMPVTIWNRHTDDSNFYSENVTLWQRVFYDGLGRVVQTHTPTADWTYDADGYDLVQDTSYDGLGRVVSQSVQYTVPSYYYDPNDPQNPYHAPDLNQPQMRTEYDMLGRVTRVSNPDGTAATMAYVGHEMTAVDANGHQMRQTVDDLGRMVQVEEFTGQAGSATVYATTHYGYDMLDNLVVVTDTKNNVTTMAYDGLGRKLAMSDPDMGGWSYAYNPAGSLTEQTDARGCAITFTYDHLERLTGKSYGGAAVCSQPPVSYIYDAGGATAFAVGQRTGMTYPGGETTYAYDVRGRLVNTTQAFSGTTFTTGYTYDDLDRQVSVTYPGGEVVTTGYDNAGYPFELASNQSAESYVSSMLYNELGSPTEMVMGNGAVTQWGYKGLRGMWDRTGTIHPYYQYGNLWRTRVSDSTGKPLFDQLLNYDNVGNVTMVREAPLSVQNWPLTGTEIFSDTFDVQKAGWGVTGQHSWTTSGGATVLRTTGVASKTQSLLTRSGYGLSAGEGVQLRFKVSNINGGAHFVLAANTSSDMYFGAVVNKGKLFVQYVDPLEQADPREPKIGYRNAADLLTTVVTDTWYVLRLVVTDTQGLYVEAYKDGDEANAGSYSLWMTTGLNWQFQEWTSSGYVDMDYYREFSMAGTAWGDNLGVDFGYDALNRLVSATPREDAEGYKASYQYDEIGNLTLKNGLHYWYEPTQPHAVTALLDGMNLVNTYDYDLNGNQIGREIIGVSTSDRHYDVENRMTVVTETANSLTEVTRFFYDGDGVRIAQATDAGVTFYVGDLYEEFHVAGTSVVTATKYYYLGSRRVAMRTGSAVFYLHGDHLGSTSLTTDQSGAVVSKQRYYPFGEVFDPEGRSPTDFGFTGQRLDDSTGLMYYRARYYDAALGRFVQADTIVPGAASGAGGAILTLGYDSKTRLTPLTVAFSGFVGQVFAESQDILQFGAFFRWDSKTRQGHNAPTGPANPQALNRYSYVLNNPLRYVDPTGYIHLTFDEWEDLRDFTIDTYIEDWERRVEKSATVGAIAGAAIGAVLGFLGGTATTGVGGFLAAGAGGAIGGGGGALLGSLVAGDNQLNSLKDLRSQINEGANHLHSIGINEFDIQISDNGFLEFMYQDTLTGEMKRWRDPLSGDLCIEGNRYIRDLFSYYDTYADLFQ
ncbi:MAG: hypothetical protein JXA21_29695 [Anaerolineae bacterium]|nr:hypothetical protein [Anaerolineae bacterium]